MWYRQDTLKGGSPWDAWGLPVDCGTPRTLGQLSRVGVLGMPGDSQWIVGHPGHWDNSQGWRVLGMSQGLPIGLWDRQDTGTTAKGGSPWDVSQWDCGTDRTLGQLPRVGVLGMFCGVPVGQTGHWDNCQRWESLGCPRDSQWDCGTDRTLGQPQRCGSLWDDPGISSPLSGTWDSPIGNRNAVGISGHEWAVHSNNKHREGLCKA